MSDRVIIKVADIIGDTFCITHDDGQKIFEKLVSLLKEGKHVTISFERVRIIVCSFLNVAIGQLYGTFTEEQIRKQLQILDLVNDNLEILKRVVDNAKRYYAKRDMARQGK